MLISDRRNRSWIIAISIVTMLAVAGYVWGSVRAGRLLGGGSLVGLAYGVIGGLICLFEMLLWPRKAFRRWGQLMPIGWTQTWMRAHVWLGLLSLPLLVMHGRVIYWGGTLSTALMILYLLVIASGIWGLVMQQILPRKMLEEVEIETVYSQIDYVRAQLRGEATRLILAASGRDQVETVGLQAPMFRVPGKVRTRPETERVALIADTGPLLETFRAIIAPYLCPDAIYTYYQQDRSQRAKEPPVARERRHALETPDHAAALFASLRSRIDPAAHDVVSAVEALCTQRRQLGRQARLHVWLHNWLAVHLPLSVAMTILMIVHAVAALMYL